MRNESLIHNLLVINLRPIDLLGKTRLSKKLAEKLIGDLLKISPVELFLQKKNLIVSPAIYKKFKKIEGDIIEKDLPHQYATGKSWFYGREFYVNKNVLIPRVETELLVEQASNFIKNIKKVATSVRSYSNGKGKPKRFNIIDIGTGSGCIAISLASEIANLKFKIFASDISLGALKIARKNAKKYNGKINFFKSDLLDNPKLPQKFDLVLANLPYLPSTDIVPKNSIYFEPKIALDGGKDGLSLIKKLILQLPNRLNEKGLAILEIDPRQKEILKDLLDNLPYLKHKFAKDLNNRTRFLTIAID